MKIFHIFSEEEFDSINYSQHGSSSKLSYKKSPFCSVQNSGDCKKYLNTWMSEKVHSRNMSKINAVGDPTTTCLNISEFTDKNIYPR